MAIWTFETGSIPPRDGSSIRVDVARIKRDGVDLSAEVEAAVLTIEAGEHAVLELRLVPSELRVVLVDPDVLLTDAPIEKISG